MRIRIRRGHVLVLDLGTSSLPALFLLLDLLCVRFVSMLYRTIRSVRSFNYGREVGTGVVVHVCYLDLVTTHVSTPHNLLLPLKSSHRHPPFFVFIFRWLKMSHRIHRHIYMHQRERR